MFDAGNTLLFLDYARLAREVGEALRLPLTGPELAAGAPAATRAMESPRGPDRERARAYLETLFLRAGVPAARMEEVRAVLRRSHAERHLWCRIANDTHAALSRLRSAGLRLGVVSNSDGRVDSALAAAGIREYFDVIVDSAITGVEKPDPAIFRIALEALGVQPDHALYVGDLFDVDVLGARSAGIDAVLFEGDAGPLPPGCIAVSSLGALADFVLQEELSA